MDAVRTDDFGVLFNSPLEAGIRAVVLLEVLRPLAVDLSDLVLLDHIVVHTGDVGGPHSLHPDLPNRRSEILVRRRLVERSLDLMRRCHLIQQDNRADGIFFTASDEAASYVELLETEYSRRLKECAKWVADTVQAISFSEFKESARMQIGPLTEVFADAGNSPSAQS